MGLAAGSLVWVQRKNGSWWPGKVVGIDEISCPLRFSSPSAVKSKTPVQLLGRQTGTVEWYNLKTSKRIKAFRSAEFDGFIKNAELIQASPTIKNAKCAHREDAVLHALQLEKQEQEKSHKTQGNMQQGAFCRAKRSRCVYLAVESNHSSENSVLDSQLLKAFPSACVTEDHDHLSSLAVKDASFESQVSYLSESSFEDNNGDGMKKYRVSYGNGRQKRSMSLQKKDHLSYSSDSSLESKIAGRAGSQKWNLKELPHMQNSSGTPNTVNNGTRSAVSRKRMSNIQDLLVQDTPCKEERNYRSDTESTEHLTLEDKRLPHWTSGGNYLEDSDRLCFGPAQTDHQYTIETMWTNVDVTVQANYRKEDVPLVSLMSKLNKRAIIGHPIEVEALEDNPDVFLLRTDRIHGMVDYTDTKIHPLVWRTSKRTPVCYIANPNSSATDEKHERANKNFGSSDIEAKTKNISQAEESLLYPLKTGNLSDKNGHNLQITSQSSKKVCIDKQGGRLLQEATCVPVKLIFTKLFFAVGT